MIIEEQKFKHKFYVYPKYASPEAFFEFDDLDPSVFLILCVKSKSEEDEDIAYIFKGSDFDPNNVSSVSASDEAQTPTEFKKKVLEHYWGNDTDLTEILDIEEDPEAPSDEFMDYFE